MKKFNKILKNQKGLTLIELLAVIVILAIVAAIAVPAIGNIINNSKDKAILADASNILAGAKIAMTDGACAGPTTGTATPDVCEETELAGYIEGINGTTHDYSVSKSGNVWTVNYSKLSTIKNTKFATGSFVVANGTTTGSTSISETDLNAALQK